MQVFVTDEILHCLLTLRYVVKKERVRLQRPVRPLLRHIATTTSLISS